MLKDIINYSIIKSAKIVRQKIIRTKGEEKQTNKGYGKQ